jgi:predicted transposase YdaD
MPSVIHQPHDKFFRLSMGEPKVVTEFFTEHLPPTVLEKMNLASLKLENRTFIDDAYKDTEADVVYSTQMMV